MISYVICMYYILMTLSGDQYGLCRLPGGRDWNVDYLPRDNWGQRNMWDIWGSNLEKQVLLDYYPFLAMAVFTFFESNP